MRDLNTIELNQVNGAMSCADAYEKAKEWAPTAGRVALVLGVLGAGIVIGWFGKRQYDLRSLATLATGNPAGAAAGAGVPPTGP